MNALLSTVAVVLTTAGYETRDISTASLQALAFEDSTLIGFVTAFESASLLISNWRESERQCLQRFAPTLRAAGDKAWNVYSVFLCAGSATDEERRAICWLEEDLERTRKLTGVAVSTREELTLALLPLLPIVSRPVLQPEDFHARLKRRLESIVPGRSDVILSDVLTPDIVVKSLGDQP